ncbi:6087_t:CDS:2 [Funneliformis geosporum]|nr:6087_t:CDS:2 [Funneliformis geosporum]
MSSIETNITKVPPQKPFRRRLSFKTKSLSSPESDSAVSTTLGNGFNSVRGSIRRFRRVSNTLTGASSTPTLNQSDINDSNLTQQEQAQTSSSTNLQSPTFSSFQRLQTLASMAREQTSRLKDIDLTAAVQEMGSEIGKKGFELGSLAKEVVVERWKKRKEEPPNELMSPINSKSDNITCMNIFGESLVIAVKLTRIEKDINQIKNDPFRYWLPAIMVRCIEFLDKYGLEEVGLYRIPGSMLTVTRMRNIFNSGSDLNFSQNEDPHAVAALLKMYLREIPDPILTDALLPEFNACVVKHMNPSPTITSGSPPIHNTPYITTIPEELPKALSSIVSCLPPHHFYLLWALFSHLSRVDKNCGINKMNTSNLGLIFRPNLGISSLLFKVFTEHVDVVFGVGCKTENEALEEEKKAKEGQAPEVYHKTNISGDFSKSFEDLLNHTEHETVCPSDENKNDSVKNYLINNTTTTISTIKVGSPTLSSSSSITSPPTPPLLKTMKDQQNNDNSKDTDNSFSEDDCLLNNHNKLQRSVNIIDAKNTTTLSPSNSSNSSFRMRSRSTGLRNIPLALDFSNDSSEGEKEKKKEMEKEKKEQKKKEVNSPTLMTFDYIDKYGTKNLGILNVSARSSNWVLHHNGMSGDKSSATTAWVRRSGRRPSLVIHEEAEMENLLNERAKFGKSKVRDQILKFNGAS